MNTLISIATRPSATRASGRFGLYALIALSLTLGGCAGSLGTSTSRPAVYDFGPGALSAPASSDAALPALILNEVEAPPALDSLTVQYRLAYAQSQQLTPYGQARWSMAPAQLLRQRLGEQLSRSRTIIHPGDSGRAGARAPATLRIDLDEFSHLFESPSRSVGLVRLRATLIQSHGAQRVTQRVIVVTRPAPSPDAGGGVQALAAASDAAVQEIDAWLRSQTP